MAAIRALLTLGFLSLWLAACGGGSGGDDAAQPAGTGDVLIGLTDADGDFVHYAVDVVSLRLVKANGNVVETVPATGRLDFAAYTELTELFTAARVPNGAYVAGEITLNYATADVQVDVNGSPVPATVTDLDGNPLGTETLRIRLDERRPLVVAPGRPALLTIDFDLAASHEVDLSGSSPVVRAAPFLVAELEPVAAKDIRVRGALASVDAAAGEYVVQVRPWHLRPAAPFGEVTVHTGNATEFEIDGVSFAGSSGLAALALLAPGTPTVAQGTLTTATRRFDAAVVLAGSSVPGASLDAVLGNVVARSGDTLTVRGATVIRSSGAILFRDDVQVTIGPDTSVRKRPGLAVDPAEISVGSRVEVFGTVTSTAGDPLALDATVGRVRLLVTHLLGVTNTVLPGQLELDLRAIDRRPVEIFDFSGTGLASTTDADPDNYEVATGNLSLASVKPGDPLRIFGFVQPFGQAPEDFDAFTVVRVRSADARLGLGWNPSGTPAPFVVAENSLLVPDLANPDFGLRHHLLVGPVKLDLFELPAAPWIVPPASGPTRYAILYPGRVLVVAGFADFVAVLSRALAEGAVARGFWADGAWDRDANTLTARTMGIHLSRIATHDE
jgi:hypothetical protein